MAHSELKLPEQTFKLSIEIFGNTMLLRYRHLKRMPYVICAIFVFSTIASAQIYVSQLGESAVGAYRLNGSTINSSLIDIGQSFGIAAFADHLYVSAPWGTIAEYNLDGSVVNASLIVGLNVPLGLAANSSGLYVVENGNNSVSKYALDGTAVSSSLITGLDYPIGIAVSNTSLFVTNDNTLTLGKYNLDGSSVNTDFAFVGDVRSIAIVGDKLYLTNYLSGLIEVYDADTGQVLNSSLISGLVSPYGIAESDGHLFITNGYLNGRISEYDLDGSLVNANLVTGLLAPSVLVVVQAVPEPSAFGIMAIVLAFGLICCRQRRR